MSRNDELVQRIIARCQQIAQMSEETGRTTRRFLTPPVQQVHLLLRKWMEAAGMSVYVDSVGNLRGLYPGTDTPAKRIILGSHIDTVPNAGPYDGVLGVVLAIGLIEQLNQAHLSCGIEVIAFSEEEGVRFGIPFIGSLAAIGELSDEFLQLKDRKNISIEQAILNFGLDPRNTQNTVLSNDAFAYFEIHIEQGPVLESLNLSLAAVSAIIGQSKVNITVSGSANHAGTTPMAYRADALTGAAELVLYIESFARQSNGLVATVGSLEVSPGASNVIPGECTFTVDIRHNDDEVRRTAVSTILSEGERMASIRGLTLVHMLSSETSSTQMSRELLQTLTQAMADSGLPAHVMESGAGHDAMILARRLPSVMLFLRSPHGLSHHPMETVLPGDVEDALSVSSRFLRKIALDRRIQ